MRGFFDFETWGWKGGETVNPLCCALMWAHGTGKQWIYDETGGRSGNPDDAMKVAMGALWVMHDAQDVHEWWAHNMGRFDGLFLAAAAQRMGWEHNAIMAGGARVISWEFRCPNDKCRRVVKCSDSIALVPSSLKDAARDFELKSSKLFEGDDYKGDMRDLPLDKLKAGCFADCAVGLELLEKVESMVNEWGGEMRLTFSSTALSIIKHELALIDLPLPDFDGRHKINDIAQNAYYGGRVEVLRHTPNEDMSEYDVNSSYPAAMIGALPWNPEKHVLGMECGKAFNDGKEGVFRAIVTVPKVDIPCLPYAIPCRDCLSNGVRYCEHDSESSVFFPTGEWEAWFPGNELRYALECGVRVRLKEGIVYSRETPFAGFINKVYGLKQNAKGALRSFAKLVLNGAYGKFGQRPETTNLKAFKSQAEMRAYAIQNPGKFTPIGKGVNAGQVKSHRWPAHTNYAVAAYITAGARIALHKYLSCAIRPAYCDSDSIHCAKDGIPEELVHNRLGGLKVEVANFRGEYYAPKIYRLREPNGKEHLACKGFPVSSENFEKVVNGELVQKDRMRLIKTQLRKEAELVRRVTDEKRWKGVSCKRKPYRNGDTRPWAVEELRRGDYRSALSPAAKKGQDAFDWGE